MVLKEPFYGHFFSSLVKNVGEEIDTLAVGYESGYITLYINPIFWNLELATTEYKYGAIKHEILHIVYKHIIRISDFSHKNLFNIAADLVVNQYILREQLIESAIFLETFPELNLLPYQSVNYYYNKLMDLLHNDTAAKKMPNSFQNLKSYMQAEDKHQRKHRLWEIENSLPSIQASIAEQAIDKSLLDAKKKTKQKQLDNLSQSMQQALQQMQDTSQAQVNWQRILRLFTATSRKTKIRNTLKRPSKRYGSTPGIRIVHKQKILVAIDTSGSINIQELHFFFQELYYIWKQGAEIYVLEVDNRIRKEYTYTGKPPENVSGGGGTSFEPAIQYANQSYRPDAMIYFTDGYANVPKVRPKIPILWILSKDGIPLDKFAKFPGRKLKIT
ncbi:MAG: VWA-like domain-containing protein [Spirochaetota bacterium]